MRHVVHLTSAHPPYDVRIFHKECQTLYGAGYKVTLLVAAQSDSIRNGVEFINIKSPANRRERMLTTTRKIAKKAIELDADLYHFHDPELIPVGLLLKMRGKYVIYDVHEELAPDILEKNWIPKPFRPAVAKSAGWVQSFAAGLFDGIIASRPSLTNYFPRHKTALVNNFPLLEELAKPNPLPFEQRPPICAYVGVMTRIRGLVEIVNALGCLPDSFELELYLAGTIDEEGLQDEVSKLPGWKRVRLLGWQSRQQVADLLNYARFGLIMFLPVGNHIHSFPTKIFEYMSVGLPILASNMPLWQEIVEQANVGKTVNPKDPQAIAAAMQWMMEHSAECATMSKRGIELVQQQYNWDVEAQRLLGLYRQILKA